MLVGHLAVALVAKRIEPKISLGTWTIAALLSDLILFPLLIAGIEHVDLLPVVSPGVNVNRAVGRDIVYSHGLLMNVIWAGLFAAIYFLRRRYSRGALLLFAVVLSHWLLDFISHRPDMPLAPWTQQVFGLGLWNSLPATLIVEGGFWLLAVILYARATRPMRRMGSYAFWIGVILLTLVWRGNLSGGMDPSPVKAGIGGLIAFGLMAAWAYWINRLRPMRE
jgi:hypothetical protein